MLGGFWERGRDPGKVRNACVHLGPEGDVRAVYRKIDLFDVDLSDGTSIRESQTVEAGEEPRDRHALRQARAVGLLRPALSRSTARWSIAARSR